MLVIYGGWEEGGGGLGEEGGKKVGGVGVGEEGGKKVGGVGVRGGRWWGGKVVGEGRGRWVGWGVWELASVTFLTVCPKKLIYGTSNSQDRHYAPSHTHTGLMPGLSVGGRAEGERGEIACVCAKRRERGEG